MSKKIVIIGGGVAGINVMEELIKLDPELNITIIKQEQIASFSTCGMIYALHGIYPLSECILHEKEFYAEGGVDFRENTTVTGINVDDNYISIKDEKISYDFLVIATGRNPKIPTIRGADLDGVYQFSNENDALKIMKAMKSAKSAVVIGAGIIGLQSASAFAAQGLKTTIIESCSSLLPSMLDSDMAKIVLGRMKEDGIKFILGESVKSINGSGHVSSVSVGEEKVQADMVVISAGMIPNADIAQNAGINTGSSGGIHTNKSLMVKRGGESPGNVYALGDCIEVIDAITNSPKLSMLASSAVIQARVVANNILGRNGVYHPVLNPAVTVLNELQIGSVGITSEIAKKEGIEIVAGKSKKATRARFFPGRKPITIKLLFNLDAELIGAQAVSEETVPGRIDAFTIAIRKNFTAYDLLETERCFEPALSLLTDAAVDAAQDAIGKL